MHTHTLQNPVWKKIDDTKRPKQSGDNEARKKITLKQITSNSFVNEHKKQFRVKVYLSVEWNWPQAMVFDESNPI